MHRAPIDSRCNLFFGDSCGRQCTFRGNGGIASQAAIDGFDAAEHRFSELKRRKFARFYLLRDVSQRSVVQFFFGRRPRGRCMVVSGATRDHASQSSAAGQQQKPTSRKLINAFRLPSGQAKSSRITMHRLYHHNQCEYPRISSSCPLGVICSRSLHPESYHSNVRSGSQTDHFQNWEASRTSKVRFQP